jgi:hypothetical protein
MARITVNCPQCGHPVEFYSFILGLELPGAIGSRASYLSDILGFPKNYNYTLTTAPPEVLADLIGCKKACQKCRTELEIVGKVTVQCVRSNRK